MLGGAVPRAHHNLPSDHAGVTDVVTDHAGVTRCLAHRKLHLVSGKGHQGEGQGWGRGRAERRKTCSASTNRLGA